MSKREIQRRERQRLETERRRLIRFRDLQERGVVQNWTQLKRLVDTQGFPSGFWLSLNTRAWFEDEIDGWVRSRPVNRDELSL